MRALLSVVATACSLVVSGQLLRTVERPDVYYARKLERKQNAEFVPVAPVNTQSRPPVTHVGGVAITQLVSTADEPYSLQTAISASESPQAPSNQDFAATSGSTLQIYHITALPPIPSDSPSLNRSYSSGRKHVGPLSFMPLAVIAGTVLGGVLGWWLAGKVASRANDDNTLAGPKYAYVDDDSDNEGQMRDSGLMDKHGEMLSLGSRDNKSHAIGESRSWFSAKASPFVKKVAISTPAAENSTGHVYSQVQTTEEEESPAHPRSPVKSKHGHRLLSKKKFSSQRLAAAEEVVQDIPPKAKDVFGDVAPNALATLPAQQSLNGHGFFAKLSARFISKHDQSPSVSPVKRSLPCSTPELEAGARLVRKSGEASPGSSTRSVEVYRKRTMSSAFAHRAPAHRDTQLTSNRLRTPPKMYSPEKSAALDIDAEGSPSKHRRKLLPQASAFGVFTNNISSTFSQAKDLLAGDLGSSSNTLKGRTGNASDDIFTALPSRKSRAELGRGLSSPHRSIRPVGSSNACSVKSVDSGVLPKSPPRLSSPRLESALFFGSASSVATIARPSAALNRDTSSKVQSNRPQINSPKKSQRGSSSTTSPKQRYEARRSALTKVDNILSQSWYDRRESGESLRSGIMFGARAFNPTRLEEELSLVEEVERELDLMLEDVRRS